MDSVIGGNIKRLREDRGWSQARLARETSRAAGMPNDSSLGRQEISRYETGKRRPREWLPFIAEALGVGTTDLTGHGKSDNPPPNLEDYLPQGDPLERVHTQTGRRIDIGTVAALRQRVHGLRLADDVISGRDLIRPALRELRSAVALHRESVHSEKVGRELLSQIAELAQIAGWIASDAGQHCEAETIYRLGIGAARQAGDSTLEANLAGSLAYQFSNTGRETEGLALARAASHAAENSAPPRARALYLDRVAWAHAKTGEAKAAIRALGEASEALAEDSPGLETPTWLYWVDENELRVMEARCHTELRRPLRAVPLLQEVLREYNAAHTRELALYLSWLAVALADANEPEEAAATAERVIHLSETVSSARTSARVRVVLRRLEEYSDVPEVAVLLRHRPGQGGVECR